MSNNDSVVVLEDEDDIILLDDAEPAVESESARNRRLIEEMRKQNDESTRARFSRKCGVCLTDNPLLRSVFSACGHVMCRACAEQMKTAAEAAAAAHAAWGREDDRRHLACPFCRKEGGFVSLFEDRIEDAKEDEVVVVETIRKKKTAVKKSRTKRNTEPTREKRVESSTLPPDSLVCSCGFCVTKWEMRKSGCPACYTRIPEEGTTVKRKRKRRRNFWMKKKVARWSS